MALLDTVLCANKRSAALIVVCLGLSACDQPQVSRPTHLDVPDTRVNQSVSRQVVNGTVVASAARSALADACQQAEVLTLSIQAMLQAPDDASLKEAQQHWQSAYRAFLVFRAFSYLPISDPPEWRQQRLDAVSTLALLDSWPVIGGYIDAVPGYPASGIVNDLTLEITPRTLLNQQGFSSEYDVSLGFHAIDFLLQGESGQRDPADFIPLKQASEASKSKDASMQVAPDDNFGAERTRQTGIANHQRRRAYLQMVTNMLFSHLERLERRWRADGHYTLTLEKSEPSRVLFAVKVAARQLITREILDKRLNQPEWNLDNRRELDALNQGADQLVALVADVVPELAAWNEPITDPLFTPEVESKDQQSRSSNTSVLEGAVPNRREVLSLQAQRRLSLLAQ